MHRIDLLLIYFGLLISKYDVHKNVALSSVNSQLRFKIFYKDVIRMLQEHYENTIRT